jgi:protein SMG7
MCSLEKQNISRHAVQLSPTSGQPYNQLALLAANKGDQLSTVFNYVRSMAVRHPFTAAGINLDKTLKRCATSTYTLNFVRFSVYNNILCLL